MYQNLETKSKYSIKEAFLLISYKKMIKITYTISPVLKYVVIYCPKESGNNESYYIIILLC